MVVDPMMGASAPQGLTNTQPANPEQMATQQADMAAMQQAQAPAAPAPKPPSMIPSELAVLLAESFNNAKLEAAKGLVAVMGDPRGAVNAKNADILRVWRKRNPDIDPLYEKFVNGLSDDQIMEAMYPARKALIKYGHRTYTEQVQFAEHMAELDRDPRYANLDTVDEEEDYIPPQSRFPSPQQQNFREEREKELEEQEE